MTMNKNNNRPKGIAGIRNLEKDMFLFFISTVKSDSDISILKLKDYFGSNLLVITMAEILQVISGKNNIQALYIQNFECINNNHITLLIDILKHDNCNIWCIHV